jgi:hypothetical protein
VSTTCEALAVDRSSSWTTTVMLAIIPACGGARSSAPGEARPPEPVYEPLFRRGQTWDFTVELVEEAETGASHTTTLPPQHCAVTDVRKYRAARLATVVCEPSDPDPELAQRPPIPLAGRVLSTAAGLWTWPPKDASEDADQEAFALDQLDPKEMLVPAALAQVHRKLPSGCLESPPLPGASVVAHASPPDGFYSLLPWRDAWCVTVVQGCNSTWRVQCFRSNVGWIGGAWHGNWDPASPRWQEVRWGEAPAYPFGMD